MFNCMNDFMVVSNIYNDIKMSLFKYQAYRRIDDKDLCDIDRIMHRLNEDGILNP